MDFHTLAGPSEEKKTAIAFNELMRKLLYIWYAYLLQKMTKKTDPNSWMKIKRTNEEKTAAIAEASYLR